MKTTHRRLLGFASGTALGVAYSLATNLINRLILPDLPFYDPWPGWFLLILGSSLLSGVMGLIVVWSEETFIGLLISSFLGSAISSFWGWRTEGSPPALLILAFIVFLPRIFLYFPLGIAVHWIVHQWQRIYLVSRRNPGKVIVPVVCILSAIAAGAFALHPMEVRHALVTTVELIQLGGQADSEQDLPEPLQDVWYFKDYATGDYTLEVSLEPDRLPVQRPIAEYGKLVSLIIVRYSNGFMFGCVYTPPREMPVCGNFH
jgi:hypothetical protein